MVSKGRFEQYVFSTLMLCITILGVFNPLAKTPYAHFLSMHPDFQRHLMMGCTFLLSAVTCSPGSEFVPARRNRNTSLSPYPKPCATPPPPPPPPPPSTLYQTAAR